MTDFLPLLFGRSPIVIGGDGQFDISLGFDLGGGGIPSFGALTSTGGGAAPRPSMPDTMVVSRQAYDSILQELDTLRTRVADLEAATRSDTACDCREIPNRKAKTEIAAFFRARHGEDLYPSDVSRALSLPYEQVSLLMEKLAAEGKIGPAR